MENTNFTWMHRLATVLVLVIGTYSCICLFDLQRERKSKSRLVAWLDKWQFWPEDLGGFSYVRLLIVSVFGLFLEMLLIRWVSSEIRIFAYFKNFVLVACYLGFGLGCCLCRRRISLPALLLPLALLALLVKLPWAPLREMVKTLPNYLGIFAEVDIWGVPTLPLDGNSLGGLFIAVMFTVPFFALLSITMIPIGQLVGWSLENAAEGITGYTVNILGSLAGILLYSLLCFAYAPPALWFAVGGLMLLPLLWRAPRLAVVSLLIFAVCIGLTSLPDNRLATEFWSPYQKLVLKPERSEEGEVLYYDLTTNDSWHQKITNLTPEFVSKHPQLLRGVPLEWTGYNLPYKFHPQPSSTLVLGSGMGNDVAAALRNGSKRVVAVEIDPLILKLGRQYHFEKPYDSPLTVQVVDDARSYLQNSTDQFDLVLFSLLDSHTTSSHYSNIRIDNYVYTLEALQAGRKLLTPDGLFLVKFRAENPWIAGRLKALLTEVFEEPPLELVLYDDADVIGDRFYISGSGKQLKKALANQQLAEFVQKHPSPPSVSASLTTDDWPYFYQHEPGLPSGVLIISVVLALLYLEGLRRGGMAVASTQWHFFFLGAGFMLLEVQIISKMALLFGTTWLVNSIVIAGLLLLIVAANMISARIGQAPFVLAFAGLFLALSATYLIPVQLLFLGDPWLRGVVAAGLLGSPVFFAALVFIHSFARAGFSGSSLGSNLFGAMVGGLLESISLWTGLKALLIIAALLYFFAFLARPKKADAALLSGQ